MGIRPHALAENAGADPEGEEGMQEDEGEDGIKRKRGGAKKWTSEKQRRRAMGDDLDKKKGWEQPPDDSGLVSLVLVRPCPASASVSLRLGVGVCLGRCRPPSFRACGRACACTSGCAGGRGRMCREPLVRIQQGEGANMRMTASFPGGHHE